MEVLFNPEFGSSKFQLHVVIVPEKIVVKSVKQVGLPRHTVVELKLVAGIGFTITVCCNVSMHPKELVAMSVTVKVPELLYV